jgi:hypothetical protein
MAAAAESTADFSPREILVGSVRWPWLLQDAIWGLSYSRIACQTRGTFHFVEVSTLLMKKSSCARWTAQMEMIALKACFGTFLMHSCKCSRLLGNVSLDSRRHDEYHGQSIGKQTQDRLLAHESLDKSLEDTFDLHCGQKTPLTSSRVYSRMRRMSGGAEILLDYIRRIQVHHVVQHIS